MSLLDLLDEVGVKPKRTSSASGGEYHSACPSCGGEDRFCVWPNQGGQGRYWCRQCNSRGDGIQFCRDFLGLSFKDACCKLKVEVRNNYLIQSIPRPFFSPRASTPPSDLWRKQAEKFLQKCSEQCFTLPQLESVLKERRITSSTALKFGLTYNPSTIWDHRSKWGVEDSIKEDGRLRKIWLPGGLVIPTLEASGHMPIKLKIRRSEWSPEEKLPKYVEVSGSQQQYSTFGERNNSIILVEAELDAILLQQEAGDLCCSIALGGCGKRPDDALHRILLASRKILFSLDFDDAGKKAYSFWKKVYPKVTAWPAPMGKSPSEALIQGVDLREWLLMGIEQSRAENYRGIYV